MSYSSEEETDISDSELDEYVDRCYEQLKDGIRKVKFSDEVYRCPYCPGKKKLVYALKDLLQHASDVGKGSQNRDIKHKGKHLGLVRYIKNDLAQQILMLKSSRLKSDLAERGFDPVRVRLLSTGGYAVVEFKKDWSGFYMALMFEKEFEVDRHGKKDYCEAPHLADELYGWVARDDDYDLKGPLGEYLQKNGDLKTISDLVVDEKRKTGLLIANLSNTIQELRTRVDELESNYCKPPAAVIQKDEMQ
ncbi:protein INVOLVED IN DE NOVO 2 [Sesamum angolense]|uniref:Protein INVOLVED IN DE NOVO 2 n=1 Tax=Sesamum angolense TaxID=2727404 RepID=A0AAE1XBI4_9LAMI|nr:protein INVOLVED IN DE NOVO 2 [Sesamum angolense]